MQSYNAPLNDMKFILEDFLNSGASDTLFKKSDLELDENISTNEAVSEMRKLMDQIDELFIPSIRETAKSAGIELE